MVGLSTGSGHDHDAFEGAWWQVFDHIEAAPGNDAVSEAPPALEETAADSFGWLGPWPSGNPVAAVNGSVGDQCRPPGLPASS
jgi:hypothetical protein